MLGCEDPVVVRTNAPRAVRFLRHGQRLRQRDLAATIGVSRDKISRLERGRLGSLTLDTVDRVAGGLGATVSLELQWHGEQLDRLMDAAHAGLQQAVAQLLTTAGWLVRVEVSFNRYGDRGRCDILAFHPVTRILLVVEIKSRIGDVQETLGRLDVKVRLGPMLARELGWGAPEAVVPALVLAEDRTSRRIVARHHALFDRFALRGWVARRWVRRPASSPSGLLWFQRLTDAQALRVKRGQRVRR